MQGELENNSKSIDGKRLKIAILIAFLFVFLLWIVKAFELIDGVSYYKLGVYPRKFSGLLGILLAPFIHSDLNHIINNSVSFFILLTGLIYFYRDLSFKVLIFIWLLSGLMVWIGAREAYHIGISGIIYGIASFMFFSGVFRKDTRLMAISLLVVFLYGGMVWGVLPVYPTISWEYHLFGAISGLIAAVYYRKEGPQRHMWSWELEEDDEDESKDETDTFNQSPML